MTDTITVWVMEHDDDEVRFVINTEDEMNENFADFLDQTNDTPGPSG